MQLPMLAILAAVLALPVASAQAQVLTLEGSSGETHKIPSPPPGSVSADSNLILLAGGIISLRIPAGWERDARPDAHIAIRATRYDPASSTGQWAECRVMVQHIAITNGATQAHVNARFIQAQSPVVADARADGSLLSHAKEAYLGDVVMERIVLVNPGSYTDNRQFMVVHEGQIVAVHVDCSIARPELARDKADIEAFLDSITIIRPS
jgi:hypothetical protein